MSDCCKILLSEGLDLCVRGRKLDAQERTNDLVDSAKGTIDLQRYSARHNALHPESPVMTRSGTIALWVLDQYERDVAEWETKTRKHLSQGCHPARAINQQAGGRDE